MNKPTIEPQDRTVHGHFGRFAAWASGWLGSTWAFVAAGLAVVVWLAAGPILHYSQPWVQVIGTGASVATFLMVFLIQNTQNRDSRAINLKLNELIPASRYTLVNRPLSEIAILEDNLPCYCGA